MSWFQDCRTADQLKTKYRELAKVHHPDVGGKAETFKAISEELDYRLKDQFQTAFDEFAREKGFSPKHKSGLFQAMIRKIMDFNVRIEIIGYWIYAFDSYGYRKELKDLGFWFSKKHKAWVFSGGKKLRTSTRLSTDEVRGIHGSEVIRNREAVLSIG
jgi:curved DNA-binding protein CbpA